MSKVCVLPKSYNANVFPQNMVHAPSWDMVNQICNSPSFVMEDVSSSAWERHNYRSLVAIKLQMVEYVKKFFEKEGVDFDEFNGLAPTRINSYKAYEFSTLWLWSLMITTIEYYEFVKGIVGKENFYTKYAKVISSVFKKYPKLTGILMSMIDLKIPGNQFLDYAKMDEADFDADHSDEFKEDSNANAFKDWIMEWCGRADSKDKMRVNNWFVTKKSHKQIFSEIQRVVGNTHKFNTRLALFVERLFNHDGLEYLFEKSGYESKEDMFMAYFDKLTMFDENTKRSFIRKFLV